MVLQAELFLGSRQRGFSWGCSRKSKGAAKTLEQERPAPCGGPGPQQSSIPLLPTGMKLMLVKEHEEAPVESRFTFSPLLSFSSGCDVFTPQLRMGLLLCNHLSPSLNSCYRDLLTPSFVNVNARRPCIVCISIEAE